MKSQKPAVKRLVGTEGDFGKPLGLSNAWAANAIRAVGNYGEIFDRNVGVHTKLGDPARTERTVGQRRHPVRPGRAAKPDRAGLVANPRPALVAAGVVRRRLVVGRRRLSGRRRSLWPRPLRKHQVLRRRRDRDDGGIAGSEVLRPRRLGGGQSERDARYREQRPQPLPLRHRLNSAPAPGALDPLRDAPHYPPGLRLVER